MDLLDRKKILMNRAEYQTLPTGLQENLDKLIGAVNGLLLDLESENKLPSTWPIKVSSGYRSPAINATIGGAKASYHMRCMAVDLHDDAHQTLANIIAANPDLLRKHGLFMEDPTSTKGAANWVHLDIGVRADRPSRIFKP